MYNFKNLCPFKWFVLQNFPFIEADFDAITNWQLMCKLGEEINKVIEKVNLTGKQVEDLTNAFNELQEYVENYFENLDVQDEINTKLDEMAIDGTLAEIINQEIFADINNKISNNFNLIKNMNYDNNVYGYAWRGLTTEAPENSIPAIIKAGKNNCYGVEIDIQTTLDNEIILMHDLTVDRTTDGTGTVNELNYSYISSLHIDSGKYVNYYTEDMLIVPRLVDILYQCRMYHLQLMLDLKGNWSNSNLENLTNILKYNNLIDFVTIQSYNANYLTQIRTLNKNIKLCYIIEREPTQNDIDYAISIKPSCFNIAFLGEDYVMTLAVKQTLIDNNIEFGFSIIETARGTRLMCRYNNGLSFLIHKWGLINNSNIITRPYIAIINENGFLPYIETQTNDRAISLGYMGFECNETETTNVYEITYSTPLFSRYSEYNGIIIPANIYATDLTNNPNKYQFIFTAMGESKCHMRILNTLTNEYVSIEDVYNDVGTIRIQFALIGYQI